MPNIKKSRKKRAYFPENEEIWFVSESNIEKQDLEDGLNRETKRLRTVTDLLHAAESATREGQPRASLVITNNIPEEIKKSMTTFINAINLMWDVNVYEINMDTIFENGFQYGSIRKLYMDAREIGRATDVENLDPTDKQNQLIQKLYEDLELERKKIADIEQNREQAILELKEKEIELKDVLVDIDSKYIPEKENAERKVKELDRSIETLQMEISQEQEKVRRLRDENNHLESENVDKSYTIQALQTRANIDTVALEDKESIIAVKEKQISELVVQKTDLLSKSVNDEIVNEMNLELIEKTRVIESLEQDLKSVKTNSRSKEMQISKLLDEIESMRSDNTSVAITGRSVKIEQGMLDRAKLVYIKVIDDLPYHKLATSMLFQKLYDAYDGKASMVILKHNEGLDDIIFNNLEIYSDLGDVPTDDKQFRLFPSSKMFSGIENFEFDNELIVFMDYIQSSEYYLDSKATTHYMTMVQHSDRLAKYPGLKGSPISLDDNTIFPIRYDVKYTRAAIKETRRNYLDADVDKWFGKLNVTK